jgi:hypothetical protein
MYRHRTFCSKDLGTNQVLEAFPVGRRLAFDAHQGRLWVVCPTCERWNLTPLEERWEAVEGCERHFREVEYHARKLGWGYAPLQSLPAHIRLALEMGAHEDQERAAAQGELARLGARWREGEEG